MTNPTTPLDRGQVSQPVPSGCSDSGRFLSRCKCGTPKVCKVCLTWLVIPLGILAYFVVMLFGGVR